MEALETHPGLDRVDAGHGPTNVIAHIAIDHTERVGLCGAEMAGIKPVGIRFDRCHVCQELSERNPSL